MNAAIEIILKNNQKIVVIHAEIPRGIEWSVFKEYLAQGNYNAVKYATWGRNFSRLYLLNQKYENGLLDQTKYRKFIRKNELHKEFKKLENSKLHQFSELYKEYLENSDVSDIKCVLQGHSINSAEGKLTNFGNRYFLDTGAFLTESFLNYNEDQKYEPFEDNQYKLTLLNIKDIK